MKTITMPKKDSMTIIVQMVPIRLRFVGRGRKQIMDDKRRQPRTTQKREMRRET